MNTNGKLKEMQLNFAVEELRVRGYEFDGFSKNGSIRAIAIYPQGSRHLYFELIKCSICKKDYLKPKWSKSKAHQICSVDKLNGKKS